MKAWRPRAAPARRPTAFVERSLLRWTTDDGEPLAAAGVHVEPVTEADAELAGALRGLPGGRQLYLGDRCCLALGVGSDPPVVLTADRAWAEIDLPVEVRLLR